MSNEKTSRGSPKAAGEEGTAKSQQGAFEAGAMSARNGAVPSVEPQKTARLYGNMTSKIFYVPQKACAHG